MADFFPPASGALLAATLLLSACGDHQTRTPETAAPPPAGALSVADSAALPTDSVRMAKSGGVLVDGVALTADKTLVENAAAAKSVSTWSRP